MGGRRKLNKAMKKLRKEEVSFDQLEGDRMRLLEALKGKERGGAKQLSKKWRKKHRRDLNRDGVTVGKPDEAAWFKVRVSAANVTPPEKAFLLESFGSMIEDEWTMYGYHTSTTSSKFYVEGASVANTITALSKRIKSSEGKVLQITAEPCRTFMQLNITEIKLLREVLARRHDTASGLLDLRALQKEPGLVDANILLVMSDGDLLKQVLLQVRDHFPSVTALDLSHNLLHLANVKTVVNILKSFSISALNLEKNRIQSLVDLVNALGMLPSISELKLEGNPCTNDISSKERYIRTICTKLPSLKTLDGVPVETVLAAGSSQTSPPVEEQQPLTDARVKQYLEQFYRLLDSDRPALQNAYVPTAEFGVESQVSPKGRGVGLAVVAEGLEKLPASQHLVESFSLDAVKLEAALAQYVVRGRVRLAGVEGDLHFAHSFSLLPYGGGVRCSLSLLEYRREE